MLVLMNGGGVQPFLPFFFCLLDGLLALDEKTDHPLRPGLSTLFMDCSQLSNMMSVAQRVRAVIFYVRLPVVMNRVAFQSGQNPNLIVGFCLRPFVRYSSM